MLRPLDQTRWRELVVLKDKNEPIQKRKNWSRKQILLVSRITTNGLSKRLEFRNGRAELRDKPRSGRPSNEQDDEVVDAVRAIVD
ncbi:hypothetical protein GE061_018434 [Apolygus lucorum]|uniref:Uncharacterized protein n=1 Tax=Apolygus lucorum TaxID=248454 RepID=A0A8S9XF82_APOLU|nr:hypothetical protein GE061_018434 [Apolygus lucorum]